MTVSEAVLFAAFVSPPMPLGRVVAIVNEPVTPTCQVALNVPVETAPGAIVKPEFDWYMRLSPLLPTNVQSLDARGSVLSVLSPTSMVNDSVKVIVPVVGAVPTLVIENVKDPASPAGRVVGPVMLGVRSGTGVVVVVVVVGGTVVVVVVGAVVLVVVVVGAVVLVVVVVAGTRAAAGALDGHEDCAPARTSLVVSTIVPTAKARTMTAAGPRRRRRTIHTSATPAAMRRSASITNVSMLAPVKASEQFTRWKP